MSNGHVLGGRGGRHIAVPVDRVGRNVPIARTHFLRDPSQPCSNSISAIVGAHKTTTIAPSFVLCGQSPPVIWPKPPLATIAHLPTRTDYPQSVDLSGPGSPCPPDDVLAALR
jgi:hypothetical protein